MLAVFRSKKGSPGPAARIQGAHRKNTEIGVELLVLHIELGAEDRMSAGNSIFVPQLALDKELACVPFVRSRHVAALTRG